MVEKLIFFIMHQQQIYNCYIHPITSPQPKSTFRVELHFLFLSLNGLIQIINKSLNCAMSDFWKPTADMFTALIEKPKMSEKLLSKPPFKYLFDIIIQTTKKTGFANGLFAGPQLNADFHSDKDKKILYLQRIIKLVELMTGQTVEAKPHKIVSGLEPENTNILLQLIHKCATSGKSSDSYVNKVLGKSEPEPEKKEEKKEVKPNRPPSAARIKKPEKPEKPQKPERVVQQPKPAPKKKEQEEEAPPPPPVVQEKPVKPAQKKASQDAQYSENIKRIQAQAENEVAAQKQTEKEEKGKNQISLGKLGGKKKKDTSQKIISAGGDLTDKELQLVQSMIQSICQNTAPLGKSIEFINDDVDAMNKELTFWRKQYNASKSKTQNQLKLTQQALMPIYDKIHEIEQQILDQKSKIQTTKAQILKNDSIIRDLLMSVVTTK